MDLATDMFVCGRQLLEALWIAAIKPNWQGGSSYVLGTDMAVIVDDVI
jgi:hypothetical protein